jgi:hypothetical protein
MRKTLFDLLDRWTLEWNREEIEKTLRQISPVFYNRGVIFFLLEELWDILEMADDPNEFMTDERKIGYLERLLADERAQRAGMSLELEVSEEFHIRVLNAEELLTSNPFWFEEYKEEN